MINTGTSYEYNSDEENNFRGYTREEKYRSIPITPLGSLITKKKEDISVVDVSFINDVTVYDAINFFDYEEDSDK